jgi:methylated-DNA-[protein]-cysteine S-methyltransferase
MMVCMSSTPNKPDKASKASESSFYAVWSTAWGPMGGVAGAQGLQAIVLPHYQADELAQLLAWEHPGSVRDEAPFAQVIDLSRRYFNGLAVDFSDVPCDLPGEKTFAGMVLRACRRVPYGQTTTYGQMAKEMGRPEASRALAGALAKNPLPLVVPCHRVTQSGGGLGGFSAPGGVDTKRRMLALEAQAVGKRS